jgi:bifunctional non-homologous end joining protein LigD
MLGAACKSQAPATIEAVADPSSLDPYRRKRDFEETSEPPGTTNPEGDGLFVVHAHAARRMHWDLRLAVGGVLKSWAVPRGPSVHPGVKRLAVEVEDHPYDYHTFEGTIPEGSYGAGAVIVWDRGRFAVAGPGDVAAQLAAGRLHLVLAGEKLRGGWMLVRTRRRGSGGRPEWLLMKKDDDFAGGAEPVEARPESADSGLTLAEIRGDAPDLRDCPRMAPGTAWALMHPRAGTRVPADPGWIYEIKWDGVRVLAVRRDGTPTLRSRRGHDVTAQYPEVAAAFQAVAGGDLVLDGEIVALGADGRPSFEQLQPRTQCTDARQAARLAARAPVTCYVFDTLAMDGRDVRGLSLAARKALVQTRLPASGLLRYCDHVDRDGARFLAVACEAGIEGIVAKRLASRYLAGRSIEWVKFKCPHELTVAIGGYTAPKGTRSDLGALHVGVRDGGALTYVGRVGSGLDEATRAALRARLATLGRAGHPFTAGPDPATGADQWCEPRERALVRYTERTRDGRLRHPVFVRWLRAPGGRG